MRLPGQALLDFRIEANGAQNCTLRQTALFEPRGLFGLMYWYAVLPLHGVVFRGMLASIQRDAVRLRLWSERDSGNQCRAGSAIGSASAARRRSVVRYDCNRRGPGDAGVQTLSPLNLQAAAGFLRAVRAAEFASASHRS